jgi:adenylate cyclase
VHAQAAELAAWNETVEERVAAQLTEIERMARVKRFFAPSLAELIVSSGNESILESHRRDIAVLFCDLRGFTAFSESAEPEDVMTLLHDYHAALVRLIRLSDEKTKMALLNFEWVNFARRGGRFGPTARG